MATKNPTPESGSSDDEPKRRKSDGNRPKKNPNMRRTEPKHSPRRIEAIETQIKALEYRKMGLNYAQIAEKLELGSPQTAWNAVESALQRTLTEPADNVRKLELERLDAMFIPVYGNAMRGDLMALSGALNIMARRARLIGLDAPDKKELTGKDGKDLELSAPTVIVIGGAGEEGEPEVMGESVAEAPAA